MNARILDQIDLAEGLGTLTLYDWMEDEVRDGRNLVRTDPEGCELWRAKPTFYGEAGQEDCFTKMMWDGAALTAFTWSCYRVAIDLESGAVTTLEFTK